MSKSNSGPTRPTANRPSKGTVRSGAAGAKKPAAQAAGTEVVSGAASGHDRPDPRRAGPGGDRHHGRHQGHGRVRQSVVLPPVVGRDESVRPDRGDDSVVRRSPPTSRFPLRSLDAVGSPSGDSLPTVISGSSILKDEDGKPIVTYVGAEYCPYCAAERWALAVALSRFGTFTNLSATHSASNDVYPNTQTLSFYGSSYSSPYVDFQPVEEATNQVVNGSYQTLQTPTAAQTALLTKYDSAGSIPFLDIANKYVVTGSSYSPQVLQGLSRDQIAAQLSDPSSAVAQAIDGTANDITAAICNVTGNQPSSVCNAPAIAAIAKKLGA